MKNRYHVLLWRKVGSSIVGQVCGEFKAIGPARKRAEKLARKHCVETAHTARRPRAWVDLHKVGVGCVEEIDPVIVPSVGELGWTP